MNTAYRRLHFAEILDRVEFRDWRFHIGEDGDRCYLQVQFDAPNAHHVYTTAVQYGRKWLLSPHMTDSEVVSTALAAVLMATEHEAREDFRYRGEAIFGPHFDVDRLFRLSDALDVRAG